MTDNKEQTTPDTDQVFQQQEAIYKAQLEEVFSLANDTELAIDDAILVANTVNQGASTILNLMKQQLTMFCLSLVGLQKGLAQVKADRRDADQDSLHQVYEAALALHIFEDFEAPYPEGVCERCQSGLEDAGAYNKARLDLYKALQAVGKARA